MTPSPVVTLGAGPSADMRPRSWPRAESSIEVGIRRSGGPCFRVRLFDLSPQGCKIEFIERPAFGERVWVKFDGLQGIEAKVRWVAGHVGGVEFEPAMHEAVFQHLIG